MKCVLDANCFINATNSNSTIYDILNAIFELHTKGQIQLFVSLQTIEELKVKKDQAFELANTIQKLPHWSIGSWNEQVGTWMDECGTYLDGARDDEIQNELKQLAKSGNDIRDRGAYIDSLRSECDFFVTSDKQFVGSGPVKRINKRFSVQVITPENLLKKLIQK